MFENAHGFSRPQELTLTSTSLNGSPELSLICDEQDLLVNVFLLSSTSFPHLVRVFLDYFSLHLLTFDLILQQVVITMPVCATKI
jgi:hypothetical protein